MIAIRFIINGTHEGARKNAIPKLKKTRGQQWTPEAKRYVAWKAYVVDALLSELKLASKAAHDIAVRNYATLGKPIDLAKRKARMDLMIHYNGEAHADPENIFGSIADALFYNDKHVAGSFDFDHDGSGRVEILLAVSE